jgi:long-chain fatty acid transport protein
MKAKQIALALVAALPCYVHATDGYFSHAYGMKSLGMGGVGAALAQEPFGGAVNPAAMTAAGEQWQVGLNWFSPKRTAERSGSGPAGLDGSASSDSTNFLIPEFGINRLLRPDLAVGLSVFGNGGMNTDFPGGQISAQSACANFNPGGAPYNLLCGTGRLGVDLSQLMIAPFAAWKFSPGQSVGIAPIIAYQRFKAEGLQAFANPMLSTAADKVTNKGYDDAFGFGARFGWYGDFGGFSAGAAYATKVRMQEFDKYKGLFAESGGFDIPSTWTIGVAFRPDPRWLLAVDYQRINYSDAKSVNNPSTRILNCFGGQASACLGASDGAGFGWQDVDVVKVGVQWDVDAKWTLRAGYNRSDNPIQARDVTFNILAPGVIKDHYTVGFTHRLDAKTEITGFVLHAAENSVTGPSLFVPLGAPPTTTEKIRLKENSIGVAWSSRF